MLCIKLRRSPVLDGKTGKQENLVYSYLPNKERALAMGYLYIIMISIEKDITAS